MSITKHFSFLAIAIFSFLLLNTQTFASDEQLVDQGRSVIIDVRTPEEYNAGHIEGAVNINYTDIASGIEMLVPDRDTTIQLYCKSGRRAGIAKETLEKMGYKNVVNEGGFREFQDKLKSQ